MILHVEWVNTVLWSAQTAVVSCSPDLNICWWWITPTAGSWCCSGDQECVVVSCGSLLVTPLWLLKQSWWPGWEFTCIWMVKLFMLQYMRLWRALKFAVHDASWQVSSNELAPAHRPVLLEGVRSGSSLVSSPQAYEQSWILEQFFS